MGAIGRMGEAIMGAQPHAPRMEANRHMRVTPVRPIAPTTRHTARRPPLPTQPKGPAHDRDNRTDPDPRRNGVYRRPDGAGVHIDLEV